MDKNISSDGDRNDNDERTSECDSKEEIRLETKNSPLKGIRSGAVIRPEPLFHRKTRLIIDTHYNNGHNLLRNGLEETEYENLKLISLDKLFDNKNETFIGFGLPNVYLTIPNEPKDGYDKFAAFMFWRQLSAIIPTKGRVQSGFLIRLRDLPENITEIIRQSMKKHSNQRHVSCAYASACVLNSAGFTSSGADLRNHFGARALFQQIYEYGLEFKGKPLTLDFIRTTQSTLEEHFHQVRKKELTSIGRTFKKIYNECSTSKDKTRAPLIVANDIPMNPIVISNVPSLTRLQISRPGRIGAIVRKIWGSHTLFRAIPNTEKIDISNYLPQTLQAFPSKNPDLFTRIKKYFLFSRPVVITIRKNMASLWDDHGEFSSGSLASMMSIHTSKDPHPYNIVITGNHLIGMHHNPILNSKLVDWLLSKHVLISGYDDDVRFAGEAWMVHEQDGVALHLSNNSGTYRPNEEQLIKAAQFVSDAFPGLKIETHQSSDQIQLPSQMIDEQEKNSFFTLKNIFIIFLAFIVWLCIFKFSHHD
ncbi:unnamed protein product [Rotaria sordida]|uniref:Uncharacterized protein n=1 Tax=Rotaria sordida TaxID=392033 RepID=A0A818P017_9BILA|nr:unnamed protein product [Rotaria sordida]